MSAFTEANRKAFDELSSTYNTKPWQLALSAQIQEALRARVSWISPLLLDPSKPKNNSEDEEEEKEEVKLLDFASGTGNASKALAPYVTKIRGIDISPQMVSLYNPASSGSGNYALEGDLFAKDGPPPHLTTPEFSNFDVAVIALGFHHFENPALALSRLYDRLKPITGVLVIVDFLPFSSSSSHTRESIASQTIKHHGFSPETLQSLFTAAGFEDFDIAALKKPAVMEGKNGGEFQERTIFIAKGRKAGNWIQKLGNWVWGMQGTVGGQMDVGKKDVGAGSWNPGAKVQEGKTQGWDMLGGSAQGRGEGRVEREEVRGWNGFQ